MPKSIPVADLFLATYLKDPDLVYLDHSSSVPMFRQAIRAQKLGPPFVSSGNTIQKQSSSISKSPRVGSLESLVSFSCYLDIPQRTRSLSPSPRVQTLFSTIILKPVSQFAGSINIVVQAPLPSIARTFSCPTALRAASSRPRANSSLTSPSVPRRPGRSLG